MTSAKHPIFTDMEFCFEHLQILAILKSHHPATMNMWGIGTEVEGSGG